MQTVRAVEAVLISLKRQLRARSKLELVKKLGKIPVVPPLPSNRESLAMLFAQF
jgi:hypothetical protein